MRKGIGVTTQLSEDVRRTAILDAAAELIAERGYHAVRVSDIAAMVGTSTGAVHYYFPGKSEVLTEALHHAVDRAFDRQSEELKKIDNAHQRLLKLIDMQLPRVGAVRDEWSIWMQFWAEATIRPELRPIHNTYYARWHETVVRIVRARPAAGCLPCRRRPRDDGPSPDRSDGRCRDPGADRRAEHDRLRDERDSRAVRAGRADIPRVTAPPSSRAGVMWRHPWLVVKDALEK